MAPSTSYPEVEHNSPTDLEHAPDYYDVNAPEYDQQSERVALWRVEVLFAALIVVTVVFERLMHMCHKYVLFIARVTSFGFYCVSS